jgi:hypothetical protein
MYVSARFALLLLAFLLRISAPKGTKQSKACLPCFVLSPSLLAAMLLFYRHAFVFLLCAPKAIKQSKQRCERSKKTKQGRHAIAIASGEPATLVASHFLLRCMPCFAWQQAKGDKKPEAMVSKAKNAFFACMRSKHAGRAACLVAKQATNCFVFCFAFFAPRAEGDKKPEAMPCFYCFARATPGLRRFLLLI